MLKCNFFNLYFTLGIIPLFESTEQIDFYLLLVFGAGVKVGQSREDRKERGKKVYQIIKRTSGQKG